jgi:hypothetical protein
MTSKWLGVRPERLTAGQVRVTLFIAILGTVMAVVFAVLAVLWREIAWVEWVNAAIWLINAAYQWTRYRWIRRNQKRYPQADN